MKSDFEKLYYETVIELLELKIKNGINVEENLKLLKQNILKTLKITDSFKTFVPLSEREKEIFPLILLGKTNLEISNICFLSINTIKKHITNILNKTGYKSRLELISNMANKEFRKE